MRELALHYFVASAILMLVVWVKVEHARQLARHLLGHRVESPHRRVVLLADHVMKAALVAFAAYIFIDPLVPGSAHLRITAPMPTTTLDNLLIRVVPIGPKGPLAGAEPVFAYFDPGGNALLSASVGPLQSRVQIDVLDESLPGNQIVAQKSVYLSPFVRRQLWVSDVSFVSSPN